MLENIWLTCFYRWRKKCRAPKFCRRNRPTAWALRRRGWTSIARLSNTGWGTWLSCSPKIPGNDEIITMKWRVHNGNMVASRNMLSCNMASSREVVLTPEVVLYFKMVSSCNIMVPSWKWVTNTVTINMPCNMVLSRNMVSSCYMMSYRDKLSYRDMVQFCDMVLKCCAVWCHRVMSCHLVIWCRRDICCRLAILWCCREIMV